MWIIKSKWRWKLQLKNYVMAAKLSNTTKKFTLNVLKTPDINKDKNSVPWKKCKTWSFQSNQVPLFNNLTSNKLSPFNYEQINRNDFFIYNVLSSILWIRNLFYTNFSCILKWIFKLVWKKSVDFFNKQSKMFNESLR